jgi:hypothetical protein
MKKSMFSTIASARPCPTRRTVSAMVSTSSSFAFGMFSLIQSTVQLPRMLARVTPSLSRSFHVSPDTLSVVRTASTSVWSGTV